MPPLLSAALEEHQAVMSQLNQLEQPLQAAVDAMSDSFASGGTVYACGNGGSASDAQHFAAELTGRFEQTRLGYPAIALTTDTSALTAIANDFGFDRIFARQLESLGRKGDVVILISTSGNSSNLMETCRQAKSQGITTIGLVGRDGGELAQAVDVPIIVPGQRTSRIQEAHIFILHFLCEAFEADNPYV
jgi:D-sedoheptulose 7-phosphate isomerase